MKLAESLPSGNSLRRRQLNFQQRGPQQGSFQKSWAALQAGFGWVLDSAGDLMNSPETWKMDVGALPKGSQNIHVTLIFRMKMALKAIPTVMLKPLVPMCFFFSGEFGTTVLPAASLPRRDSEGSCYCCSLQLQLSNEKNLGWLGYIGDYTPQLYRDYNKPL